jgi:tetratricopeptide (TPR) repeat protein
VISKPGKEKGGIAMRFEEYFQRGLSLYQLGRYEAAVEEFSHALDLRPSVAAIYYQRGLALARLGDIERAIDDFEKVVEFDPPLLMRRDAYYNLGKAYGELGRYREAIGWYDRAIDLDSDFVNAYCNRGDVRIKLGESESSIEEFERALDDLNEAISLNVEDCIAYFNRAIVHNKLAKHEEAVRDLETFLRLAPPDHPRREMAEKIVNEGSQGHASPKLGVSPKLERLRREELKGLSEKIIELNNEKRFEEAINYCDRALVKYQGWDLIWDEKAYALWNLGLRKHETALVSEALECCSRGIELNPSSERLWNTKGLILAELERYREAIGAIQKSISFASPEYGENVAERIERKEATIRLLRSKLGELETHTQAAHLNQVRVLSSAEMKRFRSEQNGFEIDIPENWSRSGIGCLTRLMGGSNRQIAFAGPEGEHLHILVGPLPPFEREPSLQETERYFRRYASTHGYTNPESGVIRVGGKDHFWCKYCMREGVLVKKYSLMYNRVEYVITCRLGLGPDSGLFDDEEIRKRERTYDEVVSTFELIS